MSEQLSIHFGLTPAERAAYDACYWVRDNPRAFRAIMALMHRQVDDGNPRTRRDDVVSYATDMGMAVSVVDELRHDHNLFAALSRLMVMLRPRLARTLHFRKSKLDDVDLAAIWHEVVNGGTVFFAKDRFEAERMVELDDVMAR